MNLGVPFFMSLQQNLIKLRKSTKSSIINWFLEVFFFLSICNVRCENILILRDMVLLSPKIFISMQIKPWQLEVFKRSNSRQKYLEIILYYHLVNQVLGPSTFRMPRLRRALGTRVIAGAFSTQQESSISCRVRFLDKEGKSLLTPRVDKRLFLWKDGLKNVRLYGFSCGSQC